MRLGRGVKWWSEIALALGVLIFSALVIDYCLRCHNTIVRNGGYRYSIRTLLETD